MRSWPLGTGPSENLSPSKASMLYSNVRSGGIGAVCAIVGVIEAATNTRALKKYMLKNHDGRQLGMEGKDGRDTDTQHMIFLIRSLL